MDDAQTIEIRTPSPGRGSFHHGGQITTYEQNYHLAGKLAATILGRWIFGSTCVTSIAALVIAFVS